MAKSDFDLYQKIPNQIAFLIIIIAGMIVAWITISIGLKIINGFPKNSALNYQTRLDQVDKLENAGNNDNLNNALEKNSNKNR